MLLSKLVQTGRIFFEHEVAKDGIEISNTRSENIKYDEKKEARLTNVTH